MTPKLIHMDEYLERFGYSQTFKHGFLFFVGGSGLIDNKDQNLGKLQQAHHELSKFDINEEWEELLGPLKDFYIQSLFEELIWRSEVNFEPRKVAVPGSKVTVSEFTFKNYNRLRSDDRKITKLFETEGCMDALFEGVGEELVSNDYDLSQSYKSGMCFFNLKAQVDLECTTQILNLIYKTLSPTAGSAFNVATSTEVTFEEYSNIQVGIACLVGHLDQEFIGSLWSYQSYVFYDLQGNEIPGISDMSMDDFIDHCRSRALFFYNKNADALLDIANKQVHWNTFPALQDKFDERPVLKQAIQNSWGYPETTTLHSDINLKTIIVFSYFNSVCETVLLSTGEITTQ
jgi:hypothetical protein